MDLFQTMTAEADARDCHHAREQCLERALIVHAHEMHRLLKAFDDAYMRDPLGARLDRVWEDVDALLADIEEECK